MLERSAVAPVSLEDAWEAFNGDEMQNLVRFSDSVAEVRDYRMRDDGTPEYVMVNQAGPMKVSHRSSYVVYEPPYRAVDEVLESPLGGRFYLELESVEGGTRISNRWDVVPNGLMRFVFPLLRSKMAQDFQADLDTIVERLSSESDHDGEGT